MTVQDLSLNIGRMGSIFVNGDIKMNVWIEGFKIAYGNPRYRITPVSGTGSQWVNADRVKILEEKGTGNEKEN